MEHVSVWGSVSAVDHRSVAALELMSKGGEVIPLILSRYTLLKKLETCGEVLVIKQIIELSSIGAWPKKKNDWQPTWDALKITKCCWPCNAALFQTRNCNDFDASVTLQLDLIVQNKLLSLKPLALWWVVFTECYGNPSRNSFSKNISGKKREEVLPGAYWFDQSENGAVTREVNWPII